MKNLIWAEKFYFFYRTFSLNVRQNANLQKRHKKQIFFKGFFHLMVYFWWSSCQNKFFYRIFYQEITEKNAHLQKNMNKFYVKISFILRYISGAPFAEI